MVVCAVRVKMGEYSNAKCVRIKILGGTGGEGAGMVNGGKTGESNNEDDAEQRPARETMSNNSSKMISLLRAPFPELPLRPLVRTMRAC